MSYTVPDGTRAALSEGGPSRKGFMLSLRDRLRLWLFYDGWGWGRLCACMLESEFIDCSPLK